MLKLSVVIPCFNEEKTLETAVNRIICIEDESLKIEIIIIDDSSSDNSYKIARKLANENNCIRVIRFEKNRGKGAALREGFRNATGDFVAINDADLEYDPQDLKRLLKPLINSQADVVIGSRFLSSGTHRVLYFWHYVGNKFLTLLSNMFTDLNLSDMESCYKLFRRDVIQNIELKEERFGFEPEIIAKVAQQRLRIFEMGISYFGRTYDEGKKIEVKDGFRALYCIFKYNAHRAPLPIQMLIYFFIGGISALFDFLFFKLLYNFLSLNFSVLIAFFLAALINYLLSIAILFKHKARWNSISELIIYFALVIVIGVLDLIITSYLINIGYFPDVSKIISIVTLFILNFLGRRFIVFPEAPAGPWKS